MWQAIESWPIDERHRLASRAPAEIYGIGFGAFTLDHSVSAPAVGYRIAAARQTVFYAPDVLRIQQAMTALRDVDVYVGDGATIERPIVRIERRKRVPVGHASIAMQLDWCARAGVPRAIFTHCGRAIVAGPPDIESVFLTWDEHTTSRQRSPRTGYGFGCNKFLSSRKSFCVAPPDVRKVA